MGNRIARCILCNKTMLSNDTFKEHLATVHKINCTDVNEALCYGIPASYHKVKQVGDIILPIKLICRECGIIIPCQNWKRHLIHDHKIHDIKNVTDYYELKNLQYMDRLHKLIENAAKSNSPKIKQEDNSHHTAQKKDSSERNNSVKIMCFKCGEIIRLYNWKNHLSEAHHMKYLGNIQVHDYFLFKNPSTSKLFHLSLDKRLHYFKTHKRKRRIRRIRKLPDIFYHKDDAAPRSFVCGQRLGFDTKFVHIIYNPVGTKR